MTDFFRDVCEMRVSVYIWKHQSGVVAARGLLSGKQKGSSRIE